MTSKDYCVTSGADNEIKLWETTVALIRQSVYKRRFTQAFELVHFIISDNNAPTDFQAAALALRGDIFLVQGKDTMAEADYAVAVKLLKDYKDTADADLKLYIEDVERSHFRARCLVEGKEDPGPREGETIPSREASPSPTPQLEVTDDELDENLAEDEDEDEDVDMDGGDNFREPKRREGGSSPLWEKSEANTDPKRDQYPDEDLFMEDLQTPARFQLSSSQSTQPSSLPSSQPSSQN